MALTPMVFKAIPFNAKWISHDKIDVKAIYRRPRRDVLGRQVTDPETGLPAWDYTGGIPVRRHADWQRKGYEYITLESGADLTKEVVYQMRADGLNPAEFIMDPVARSPWNPALYLATAHLIEQREADTLTALVEQFGSDAVLEIQRASNPTFTLPARLQGIPPGGKAPAPAMQTGEGSSAPRAPNPDTTAAKLGTIGGPAKASPVGRALKKAAKAAAAAAASGASQG